MLIENRPLKERNARIAKWVFVGVTIAYVALCAFFVTRSQVSAARAQPMIMRP